MGPLASDCPPVYSCRVQIKEATSSDIRQAFDVDFSSPDADCSKMSLNDQRFIRILREGMKVTESGKIELPFPFKDLPPELPETRDMAVRRLLSQKRRFERDPEYFKQYCDFMDKLLRNHYAERVPDSEKKKKLKLYIPHHGVRHPRKPKQLRVVFDPTAQVDGISLNSLLLSGPDLTNNLSGVLLRFRKEKVGLICDVESMFYQVLLALFCRDMARYVWFEDGDLSKPLVDYRMKVHIFGATSSPGCANFALKSIADMFESTYGTAAANFLRDNFYVDDGVISVPTVEAAVALIHSSHSMCRAGGMNLRSFSASHPDVISAIPEAIRATAIRDWEPGSTALPVEPTLGLGWRQKDDSLQYLVKLVKKPSTRRGCLSALSSVYDPLGLIGPVLLIGRLILQRLCLQDFKWDDPLPSDTSREWSTWYAQLAELEHLIIPRCIRQNSDFPSTLVTLHIFCDASSAGYGVACYVQLGVGPLCDVHLVYAKSRVAPSKAVTIPRLELQAAVLAVKTSEFLRVELKYDIIVICFWCDSRVVLAYIASDGRRFHLFVHNRVSFIRERTAVADWSYVASEDNPADLASRGCSVSELRQSSLWWHGPAWLREADLPLELAVNFTSCLEEEDPELKKTLICNATMVTAARRYLSFLERWSSWEKVIRIMARWVMFTRWLVAKLSGFIGPFYPHIRAEDLIIAEVHVIRLIQIEVYSEERAVLRCLQYPDDATAARERNQRIKKSSNMYKLDPYLDINGVIRVGGRISRAYLPEEQLHPCLVPSSQPLIRLLVIHYHIRVAHGGRQATLSMIRMQGVWICGARRLVGSVVAACVICRRLRGQPVQQQLAELPEDRLNTDAPFTHVSVDFFGPYLSRAGRSDNKRYGCLFVCQVSRAIHLELAFSLTTDSFLHCYRRMVSRRGPVKTLRCDQGTNFVGASNEIQRAVGSMNHEAISQRLLRDRCDWVTFVMNPPRASHMGGSWERLIRSVRHALNALLYDHPRLLNDEELLTLFVEAEAIVNSRPLALQCEGDVTADPPITPFSLLTLKTTPLSPLPGVFEQTDIYSRKRWRTIQYLAQCFWGRWRRDYLPTLQERQIWAQSNPNVSVGDLVLVVDDNQRRGRWDTGRIVEVYPSADGLVRRVKIKVTDGTRVYTCERPITKIILLMHC